MAKKRQMEVVRDTWKPLLESETPQTHSVAPAGKKKKWIHENKELLFGSVTYKGKHLGTVEVDSCEDKETVQKAIHDLRQKGTSKLPEVEISISVRSIIITEVKSKMHICKHKLQKIAYCSDDKITGAGDKIFAFVVKKSESVFQCYCFETQNAHRITLTVGQAFQLAWERFQEAKGASESFVVEMKRIKAKRGKEDFVKKLAEIHQSPSTEECDENDVIPELNHPRMGRRSSMGKNLTALDEHWQQLNDTMRILRDDDAPFPQQTELISDFDKAFASIQQEIEEWNKATSPFQSNWDVEDALQELDSALNPLGSSSSTLLLTDSQTTLPQLSSPETTAL